jgi:hypothetical protein
VTKSPIRSQQEHLRARSTWSFLKSIAFPRQRRVGLDANDLPGTEQRRTQAGPRVSDSSHPVPGQTLRASRAGVSATLFERATKNMSESPTSQSILDGLRSIEHDDLGRICASPDLHARPDRSAGAVLLGRTNQVGQHIQPNGNQRTCTASATT